MVPAECYLAKHSSLLELFTWPFMVDEWRLFVIHKNDFAYSSTTAIAMTSSASECHVQPFIRMLMDILFLALVFLQVDSGKYLTQDVCLSKASWLCRFEAASDMAGRVTHPKTQKVGSFLHCRGVPT